MIRASFAGTTYLYQPFILVDNEIPLTAGREIWGYAKKLAVFERNWGGSDVLYGEQMTFTVQHPVGVPLMTATMVADRLADPAELEDCPVLSTRIIPNSERNKRPSVAELVRLDVPATLHKPRTGRRASSPAAARSTSHRCRAWIRGTCRRRSGSSTATSGSTTSICLVGR